LNEKFKPLTDLLQKTLSAYISEAKVSQQLTTSPCAVIASNMALSATMERIMKSQALSKKDQWMLDFYSKQKYIFEINPVSFF
jgi:heat shock protein beta